MATKFSEKIRSKVHTLGYPKLKILSRRIKPVSTNRSGKRFERYDEQKNLSVWFDKNFFIKAEIKFEFLDPKIYKNTILVHTSFVNKQGKDIFINRKRPNRFIAESLETSFDPFDNENIFPKNKENISYRIKKLFRL